MNAPHMLGLRTLAIMLTSLLALPVCASAQERPGPVAEIAAGALLFPDDGVVTERFLGGTARVYVLPRVSIGPEMAYIAGENHSHLMLTGNVTFDFVRPIGREPRRLTPFAVVGGGLFQSREQFPNRETFTSNEGAFTAGVGVRTVIGDRVIVGAEARVGWELHLRLNGMVGVRLGQPGQIIAPRAESSSHPEGTVCPRAASSRPRLVASNAREFPCFARSRAAHRLPSARSGQS